MAALAVCFLSPLLMSNLPDRFQKGPWAIGLAIAWLVLSIGMGVYSTCLIMRNRADFVEATLEAPQEKDLLTYILACSHSDDKVADQAAAIVSELLGRLSEDQLACIPEVHWRMLCPLPDNTPSGYSDEKKRNRNDQVQAALFSAIMRMKRMEALPNIESWMLKTSRHSGAFVRSLHACHDALLKHQASLQHSSTLLRPASAEAATPEELLRPVMGTRPSETDTGEQLLRASAGQDPV